MNVTPLPVKVFTREHPCTKVDIANAFRPHGQFISRAIVETRGIIGLNTPKYLLKHDLARYTFQGDVEMLELTRAGQQWLIVGLARHLKRHPEERKRCLSPPPATTAARRLRSTAGTSSISPKAARRTPFKLPR